MEVGIVTGAASGLGRAFSGELAGQCRLLLVDLDERGLERQKTALGADRVVAALPGSVADEALWQRAVRIVREENARVAYLVNCAGVGATGALDTVPLETWRWTLETNVLGAVAACRAFVPLLKEQRSGHVINVSSAAAFTSSPSGGAYCASKAALGSFSETLYNELEDSGVTVTVACPGYFQSNLVSNMRVTDAIERAVVSEFMRRSTDTAERVAEETLDCARLGRLYYVPKGQPRLLWRLKRFFPYQALRIVRRRYADAIRDVRAAATP